MSKHSKNCNSSSVFTYQQRQKLKIAYGSHQTRISQDSIKTFEMCTICNHRLIEPTSCDQGHLFCRSCVIEYLVKQKKKIAESQADVDKNKKRKETQERQKQMEKEVIRLEAFQKYDTFGQITNRKELADGIFEKAKEEVMPQKQVKPIGIYELNSKKTDYVKTAFWTLQNAPIHVQKQQQVSKVVLCPGSNHKLTLKKLRNLILKQIQGEFLCWICSKQVKRQRVGAYRCGHLVCQGCKSNKCQVCDVKQDWLDVQRGSSSFAAHTKAQVKTYTHAFVC